MLLYAEILYTEATIYPAIKQDLLIQHSRGASERGKAARRIPVIAPMKRPREPTKKPRGPTEKAARTHKKPRLGCTQLRVGW